MSNPFIYSRPLPPEALIDREDEVARLLELLVGGHNCRLSAPRRYGKTSLIHRLQRDAENEGLPTVYVNFYGILSLEEAVERLDRGYRELRGPLSRWLAGRLESLSLSVSGPIGSASVTRPGAGSTERRLHALLDLPSQIHKKTGARAVVCFDEFQEVLSPRNALDGAIRSVIEGHGDQASYLFAGSQPGLMRALFEDRERPFYGQARGLTLHPLAAEDVAEYLGGRFDAGGRSIDAALPAVLAATQGHPQRVMMLAHYLWEQVPRRQAADGASVAAALQTAMDDLAEGFDRTWRGLDDGQRRALLAILATDGRPTQQRGLAAADAPRTTIVEALERLGDGGFVEQRDGAQRFIDPFFARWVARGRAEG